MAVWGLVSIFIAFGYILCFYHLVGGLNALRFAENKKQDKLHDSCGCEMKTLGS